MAKENSFLGLRNRAAVPIHILKKARMPKMGTDGTVLFLAFFIFFKKIYKNL